ncbi:MAG: DUF1566 domain-containing protein [SAR324 cluster bacterium]|nr:DUF1566 domain-containing protein [SAR324 cluster bacterium]
MNYFKIILNTLLLLSLWAGTLWAETQTVVQEGIAYIGNGITVEDAQKVAINDARQKALNGLGAFIESSQKATNGRLTAKEISSITGAVMSSKILEEKKEVEGATFLLKLKVEFKIDMDSFNRALAKYQETSADKQTIATLMGSLQKLQDQLLKSQKGSFETVEIADEIAFNTKKIGDLLTTKQVIDNELEIQEIYTQKVKTILLNEIIPRMTPALREVMVWQKVPHEGRDWDLFLPCESKQSTSKYLQEALNKLKQLAVEYDRKGIKTRPNLKFYSRFVTLWSMTINQDEYLNTFSTTVLGDAKKVEMTNHQCETYYLPEKYHLHNVNTVDWRVKPTHPGSLGLEIFKKTVYGPDDDGKERVLFWSMCLLPSIKAEKRFCSDEEEHTFSIGGGLMFPQTDDGKERKWSDAVNYCEQLEYAGHSDWRLPSIMELRGLWYSGRSSMFSHGTSYWSSTPSADTTSGAFSARFGIDINNDHTDRLLYVHCVRGGQ